MRMIGEYGFDWKSLSIFHNGKQVLLSPQQADVLEIIWASHPTPVTTQLIMQGLYGSSEPPASAVDTIKAQLWQVRRKLDVAGIPVRIENRRGAGYFISVPTKGFAILEANVSNVLGEFVEETYETNSLEDLKAPTLRTIEKFGFRFGGYQITHLPNIKNLQPLFLSNAKKHWLKTYVEQNMVENDPLVIGAKTVRKPFAWMEALEGWRRSGNFTKAQADVAALAWENGVIGGFTVPIADHDGSRAVVNLWPDQGDDLTKIIDRNKHLITMIANFYHSRVKGLLLAKASTEHSG